MAIASYSPKRRGQWRGWDGGGGGGGICPKFPFLDPPLAHTWLHDRIISCALTLDMSVHCPTIYSRAKCIQIQVTNTMHITCGSTTLRVIPSSVIRRVSLDLMSRSFSTICFPCLTVSSGSLLNNTWYWDMLL